MPFNIALQPLISPESTVFSLCSGGPRAHLNIVHYFNEKKPPLTSQYIVGMDFGTASARGILLDVKSGRQVDLVIEPYRHGIFTHSLPNGTPLLPGSALHHPSDYLEVAEIILRKLGRDRHIKGIGVASTASSPLSTYADGSLFVRDAPSDPHAYVKLWKHSRAQRFADEINAKGKSIIREFDQRASGEGMLAKAAETRAESPSIWERSDKFIEVGDWIVWQLTGSEHRSLDFACFKAMYSNDEGYPVGVIEGLEQKLSKPNCVGGVAGYLSPELILKAGLRGTPVVSVASIDSHAVLPAVGAVSASTIVGVLGTSSGFLMLQSQPFALPPGYEGGAFGAALPNIWCCEAGQAGFGDMLGWFVKNFPKSGHYEDDFELYNTEAEKMLPGQGRLLALDWFNGNRVPYADSSLSGLLLGLNVDTSPDEIYRALVESLAFGVRNIIERGEVGANKISRVVLTSALARNNKFLVQTISDVLGRVIHVPRLDHATAMGAAIHASVACGLVSDFEEGADRFAPREHTVFEPNKSRFAVYDKLYASYVALSSDEEVIRTMKKLSATAMLARSSADRNERDR